MKTLNVIRIMVLTLISGSLFMASCTRDDSGGNGGTDYLTFEKN